MVYRGKMDDTSTTCSHLKSRAKKGQGFGDQGAAAMVYISGNSVKTVGLVASKDGRELEERKL